MARGDDGGGRVLARAGAERCAVDTEGTKGRGYEWAAGGVAGVSFYV